MMPFVRRSGAQITMATRTVWGADYYGYENSLGVHIRHLREKLEAEPGAPQFLRTVRGIGYKLTKGEEA